MPDALIMPVCIAMGLLTWGWSSHPAIVHRSLARALDPSLLLHAFRYIGLMFLVPGVTAAPLDPRFYQPAAWGDLAAASLALAGLRAGRRGAGAS